jgi:PD-(D/E)XK nuclease superfamily protein
MNQIRLSATSISDFKACPTRYRLKYIEGLAPAVDADALRIGTTWHKLHEVWELNHTEYRLANPSHSPEEWREWTLDALVSHLNKAYENMPISKSQDEWGSEREMLLSLFLCYQGYWKDNQLEVIATEQKFEVPLMNPSGLPVSTKSVVVTGRIDQTVMFNGHPCVLERKTTGSDITPGSEYWTLWRKNEQASIYAYAARQQGFTGNVIVDVVRKPRHRLNKGESVEHFGERLRDIISQEPASYFARQEIARTDSELDEFARDLYNVYVSIRHMQKDENWWSNPHSCHNPFPCNMVPICYGCGADAACDGVSVPAGFKRTDLTSHGKKVG